MELSEVFLYILRFYAVNYFGSTILVFSGIPILYVRIFQIIMYVLAIVYLSFAIYYRIKNGKIESDIKRLKSKEK